ncbi:MAG TPA: translocation/assembly module TamB domain-containing protein [Vicinamibacteria bacterium]|nr:translocation/assembly module TamB domain-containing protein [Vicinamibacteria bacterium]
MNTRTDATPSGPPPAAGRSRARRALRTGLRLVLGLGLLAVLLAALGFAFVHSPQGRATARVFLEVWGSGVSGGTLRLGQLDLALWKGEVAVTAASLQFDGTSIDAHRVEVAWRTKAGPHVRVVRPVVRFRDTGRPRSAIPATGLSAQPWRALEKLAGAEVVEGRLELRDVKGVLVLVVDRFDAQVTDDGGRRVVSLRAVEARAGGPDVGRDVTLDATLVLDGGRLVVEQATLGTGASSVVVRGRLDRVSPVTAGAWAHAVIDAGAARTLSPGAEAQGRVEADARIDVKDGRVVSTLTASAPALSVRGVGPWAVSARGRLADEKLVLETLEARGFAGRVVAEGPLALRSRDRTDLRLRAEGFDVPALVAAVAGKDVPVAARADATLRWTTTGWDVGAGKGIGDVALHPAPRTAKRGAPGVPVSGSSRVRIEGRSLDLQDVRVAARGASLTGDAQLSGKAVSGTWSATVPLASVDLLLADLGAGAVVPEGYTGLLAAEGALAGTVTDPEATASVRGEGMAIRDQPYALEADVRYESGRLALAPLTVRSGAGRATVAGSVPVRAGRGEWDLQGEAESVDVAPVLAALGLEMSLPVSGAFRVEGTVVRVERFETEVAGGRVEGSGSYDRASERIDASATATGLAWTQVPRLPESLHRLDGRLSAQVSLGGTPAHPSGEARVTLAEPTLEGAPLPALTLEARADGRRVELVARAGETPFLQGGGPLEGDWPVRLEVDAAAVPVQAILDASPAARERRATIAASGGLTLDVPLRAPSRLRYSAEALRASGKIRQREWATEPFRLEGDKDALTLGGLRLASAGATLSVDGRVALSPSATHDLAVAGTSDLALGDVVLDPGDRATGTSTLRLQVAGAGGDPQVTGEASIEGARGRFEGARWRDLRVRARFVGKEAELDELTATVLGGSLTARGRLPLRELGRGETARLSFEAKDVDLARMLDADLRLESGASFLVSIEGEVEATAPTLLGVRARGRVSGIESKSPEGRVGLDAPAEWRLEGGRFEHDPIRITGPLGTLEARAEARFAGGPPGGTAALSGPFDLRFLSPFVPDTTLSGPASVDVRASWEEERLRLDGSLKIEKARVTLEELAFGISQLAGELRFEGDRVALQAAGEVGGEGKIRASGGMTLGPAFFGPAEVTLEAERIPIAYPEGFRGRATGKLLLSGDPESAYIVSGEVALSQGYYTAEFDAGTQSIGRLDWQLAALRGGAIGEKLPLDVDIRLAGPLRIRNKRASLDVLGSLTASGTLAQPTATGQVSLREGGTLTLSRAELRVTRGLVELNGYPGGTPELDLQGATRVGGVTVNVQARGRADDLQLILDSPDRPDLSQTDLVSLLLTGRTASAVASEGGVVVAEELASALGGVLQKGVGDALLIDVSPDRSLLADDTEATQRFNVGHRLTENLTVMYSTALDGTEQRWILDFNPGGGRFRYRVIDEETEGLSFEVTDRFSFDLWNRGRRAGGRREREIGRLASLRFEGELPLPEEELGKAAKLKVRARYSALQREQAADRVAALLAKRGWPGASVEAEVARAADRSVNLVLRVEAGPRVTFEWGGDPLGEKERRAAQAAWPAYASPDVAAAAVARAALVSLRARGHHAAKVTPEVTASEREVAVRLQVEVGRKGGTVRVEFKGNEALDSPTLLAVLPKPGSREFFEALAGRSTSLTNPVRLAYARAGYVDARVRPPQSALDPATGSLTVTLTVRERAVSSVAGIVLPEEVVAAGAEGPKVATKVGQPFDVAAYLADRDAIGAWYRREGWPDARVAGFLDPRPEGVSVRFAARAGPRPHVGEVRVAQEGRAPERLVRRQVTLAPGDLVRPHELAESRARLAELGIFRSVEVRPEARPGDAQVRDIVVNVAARPDVTVEYGLRYSTQGSGGSSGTAASAPAGGKLQAATGVELSNPLGWGWRVRGYTLLTSDRQTWGVNLDSASFFGLRLRSQILVYDEADQDIQISGLASRVKGTTFQQTRTLRRDLSGRRWHDRLRLQWGYTFKDIVYLEEPSTSPFLSGNRAFVSLSLVGDERDSLTDPTRGVFWTATTELARDFLGSDANYQRYYGQAFLYVPLLGRSVVWAQGYRLGVVPGEDPQLLIENRFRAGGPTTVRGFEQNELGPLTANGDSVGGQAVAVLNQELRFPIWKRLHGGLFWDAGNVWLTSSGFSLTDLRQSVGGGLRLMLPFGPIRVEYAWVIDPREGESKSRFVFGLGHAF